MNVSRHVEERYKLMFIEKGKGACPVKRCQALFYVRIESTTGFLFRL